MSAKYGHVCLAVHPPGGLGSWLSLLPTPLICDAKTSTRAAI